MTVGPMAAADLPAEAPPGRSPVRDPARWFAAVLAALAVASFLSACIEPYGDVRAQTFGHPQPLTVFVGIVVAIAAGVTAGSFRLLGGERMFAGLFTAVLGAVVAVFVFLATGKQTFPRTGGMWLLLAAFATVLIGLLVAFGLSDCGSRNRLRLSWSVLGAGLVVAVALVAATAGPMWWRSHTADRTTAAAPAGGAYPTSFSAVAWRHPLASDERYAGVYGGRVMVAVTDLHGCRSGVRALDALTGREVWRYLVPNQCAQSNRVDEFALIGNSDVMQVAVGDNVAAFLDPRTGQVLARGALRQALFFVSGNLGIAQNKSGSVLSTTPDNAKITVIGYDLAHRTEAWRRPAPTCAKGQLAAVLGPPSRTDVDSWDPRPTPGSSNSVVDLPDNGFAMGYACRLSQKTFDERVWIVRPGNPDRNIDLGTAQFVDILPVPILLSTPQGLLVQDRAGVRNIGTDGTLKWTSPHGKSDEIHEMFALGDGSVLLLPTGDEPRTIRLDAASGKELSSDAYRVSTDSQVHGHLIYDTDVGGVVQDALHPVAKPTVVDLGFIDGRRYGGNAVLPGVEVIAGQHVIIAVR